MNDATPPEPASAETRIGPLAEAVSALATMLRFYSRLPVPDLPWEQSRHPMPDFSRHAFAVPFAGMIIGVVGIVPGLAALAVSLPPLVAAILTVATLVFITGCFHEDGLADSADGLWGGYTPARRLEIMKDSRIGSYGAAALIMTLIMRVALIAELYRLTGFSAAMIIIAMAGATRALALSPTQALQPATAHGLGALAQKPRATGFVLANAIGLGLLALAAMQIGLFSALIAGFCLVLACLFWLIRTAQAKVGGYTGDILGASQQLCEIMLLIALVAGAGSAGVGLAIKGGLN